MPVAFHCAFLISNNIRFTEVLLFIFRCLFNLLFTFVIFKMSYQLYRNTTIGNTLQESLDELIQYGQITPTLAVKVLLQFDKSINQALSNRVKSRLTFKAGKLNTYRFCDNVWTFMLNNVEFREVQEIAKVDRVKIVACDGKNVEERR